MGDFDFDHWKDLAERDPAAFFQARDEALRNCIARHPGQAQALAAIQARIDTSRALAGTPLQASRALVSMMEDHLLLLGVKLVELRSEVEALRDAMTDQAAA